MAASPISFAVRVDTRSLEQTAKRAVRDIERVQRVALVRAANMVRGYMLQAVANNGGVVFKKTGEQIVPPFKAMSVIHDLLNGPATGGVLARKESILLNIDAAAGRAAVGWGGNLAAVVERWQDGTVGGEEKLARPEVRHYLYRWFMSQPGRSARDREFITRILKSPPKQPRREFVDAIAAFVGPRLAGWIEGATKSAIERRNDRYLDSVMDSGDALPISARIADARARGASFTSHQSRKARGRLRRR